jgi:SAM-dependent methyltransferase
MKACRICEHKLGAPDYATPAPSMTSLSTRIAVPTEVYVCRDCGHVQSPDLPDVQAFYDHDYRISLQSDDHDQLYALEDNMPVFRTEHQARLLEMVELAQGANVLDFGAAKAHTLRRLLSARPDLNAFVFDVSEDYRPHWAGWIKSEAQATYRLPDHWNGNFDLITAHFVIEHVADPVGVLRGLARCLRPKGRLFFTVPDPVGNPGDMLVADHLNHFVVSSLHRLLTLSGLRPISIRQDLFRGAHVILAEAGGSDHLEPTDIGPAIELLNAWRVTLDNLPKSLEKTGSGPIAIYGAGFYGALFSGYTGERAICFLDQNPHLQGSTLNGLPIVAPINCPDVPVILAALSPNRARTILPGNQPWLPDGAQILYPE